MNLSPTLKQAFTQERLSAKEAQHLAELISFGPIVFQVSRLMVKLGIFELLRNNDAGLTEKQIAEETGLSGYAAKVLLEASLTIGSVLVDAETSRYTLSKTGWFLLTNPHIRVNTDFNHDVNYEGFFRLEEALKEGKPSGLAHFGNWKTVYEGLSSLPKQVQDSWFAFDHYYSDCSFDQALQIVFSETTGHLLDVGGNTGRWALRCVDYNPDVRVTIMDLPQQIELMHKQISGQKGAERISGFGCDLLDPSTSFPQNPHFDAIWMSQFLDCFNETQVESILQRASHIMDSESRLYIMETLWDRQKYEEAAFCLTQTSLYFTAIANGNSKMFHSDDLIRIVEKAGLRVENIHDNLGTGGHSLLVCRFNRK